MSKLLQFFAFVAVCCITTTVNAGVSLDVAVSTTPSGNDVYTVTANSDDALITSLGVRVEGPGNIGQIHQAGFLGGPFPPDCFFDPGMCGEEEDSHVLFRIAEDHLLVVGGASDTVDLLEVYFTGFDPFASRAILQLVLTGGEAVAMIDVVAGGEEFIITPTAEGNNSAMVPEPGSIALLAISCITIATRRK